MKINRRRRCHRRKLYFCLQTHMVRVEKRKEHTYRIYKIIKPIEKESQCVTARTFHNKEKCSPAVHLL